MKVHELKMVVATDVFERDGIGVEFYFNEELIIEIFRDDTEKTEIVTFYNQSIPLDVTEHAIVQFKKETALLCK